MNIGICYFGNYKSEPMEKYIYCLFCLANSLLKYNIYTDASIGGFEICQHVGGKIGKGQFF